MPWSDTQALGVAEMDATHREFVELADALRRAGDAEFPAAARAYAAAFRQ